MVNYTIISLVPMSAFTEANLFFSCKRPFFMDKDTAFHVVSPPFHHINVTFKRIVTERHCDVIFD